MYSGPAYRVTNAYCVTFFVFLPYVKGMDAIPLSLNRLISLIPPYKKSSIHGKHAWIIIVYGREREIS